MLYVTMATSTFELLKHLDVSISARGSPNSL